MRPNPFNSHATRPGAIPYRYVARLDDDSNLHSRERTLEAALGTLRSVGLGQVIGPHGSGKSTLIADWAPELRETFPGGVWIQLTRNPHLSWIPAMRERWKHWCAVWKAQQSVKRGGVLVIDGIEQLSPAERTIVRIRARRHGHSCLVTAHRPLPGFAVLHQTDIDPIIVRQIAGDLLGDPAHPLLGQAFDQPIEDVRQYWSELYDLYAERAFADQQSCDSSNRILGTPAFPSFRRSFDVAN